MAPSLRDRAFRPSTRDRPTSTSQDYPPTSTKDHGDHSLIIPSRTSSLHSRITQPIPSSLNIKPSQRTPKTLTHAYMVCGVGREPSQWVRAPAPLQGKIAHMKGAIGQYWLPEILGSSPRLDQDNEIARSLHAAMRVRALERVYAPSVWKSDVSRLAFPMTSKFALAEASHIVFTIPSSSSKIHLTRSMVLLCESGLEPTRSVRKQSGICAKGPSRIITIHQTIHTGSRIV